MEHPADPRFQILVRLLADEAGRHLGPSEKDRLWERHIGDSLAAEPSLDSGWRVADVGSGVGLPGLVLALARPDLAVTLIEPRGERVRFLRRAVDAVEALNVEVLRCRWIDCPPRRFDCVVARALAPPPEALRIITAGPPTPRVILYAGRAEVFAGAERTIVDSGRSLLTILAP